MKHDPFFVQRLAVRDTGDDRLGFFVELVKGLRVLHVGCCDVPLFKPETNLHLHLAPHAAALAGCDVDRAGLEVLARHFPGEYHADLAQVAGAWDLVLVPEVLEHIPDPHAFLRRVFALRSRAWAITAPHYGCFGWAQYDGHTFTEVVHPDHRAWYSPWTLHKTLEPFTRGMQVEYVFVNRRESVGAIARIPA